MCMSHAGMLMNTKMSNDFLSEGKKSNDTLSTKHTQQYCKECGKPNKDIVTKGAITYEYELYCDCDDD